MPGITTNAYAKRKPAVSDLRKADNININSVKVLDVLGKQVLTFTPDASEVVIDGSTLKSGIYFAQIKTDNGTSSVKLIKK